MSVLYIAHRGYSSRETENTAAAFIAAGASDFWGIESDVHVTADGGFVMIHDANAKRVSGADINVENSNTASVAGIVLKDINTGEPRNDLRIPVLDTYLSVCKRYGKKAILEIKGRFPDEKLDELLIRLRDADCLDRTVFIAFNMENLIYLRRSLPDHPMQFLTSRVAEDTLGLLEKYRFDLDIDYHGLDKQIVDRVHALGLLVNSWTVNSPEIRDRLIAWGVDQITTEVFCG